MRIFWLLIITLSLNVAQIAWGDDAEEVRAAFGEYKAAVLKQDGKAAADLVSARTVAEYQNYVNWALDADRKTLDSLSLVNRMQVIIIRQRVPADELIKMDGRSCFGYAVDHDWIGKNGVIRLQVGEVNVSDGRATAQATIEGTATSERFQFRKEAGKWRFDLISIMQSTNAVLVMMVKQKGLSEEEFIATIVESLSGRKVPESIWEPLRKKSGNPATQPVTG